MSRPASENLSTESAFGVGGADTAPVLELAAFYDLPNFNRTPREHTGGRVKYRAGRREHTDHTHAGRDAHSAKQQGYLNYPVASPRVSSSNTATARSQVAFASACELPTAVIP